MVSEVCKPNKFDKYKMFIKDMDKVVSLLLFFSGCLARVENVLGGHGEDASKEERSSLNEKRKVLAGQHEMPGIEGSTWRWTSWPIAFQRNNSRITSIL